MDNVRTAVIFTGGHCRTEQLTPEDTRADLVIAADAGYLTAQRCGVRPDIIAGDFDSSDTPAAAEGVRIVRVPAEKDNTDTMLACDLAVEAGARFIRILGGTGGRADHGLSNIFMLENLRRRGVRAEICDGDNRIRLLENESCTLSRTHYRYFSLLALTDARATLTGCKYPLTDAPLTRSLPYAVSNEIAGGEAHVTVSGGPVLLLECGDAP